MSAFVVIVLLYTCIVSGDDYITFGSVNYTQINPMYISNITLKLPSSADIAVNIDNIYQWNITKCTQMMDTQNEAITYRIDFIDGILIEILKIKVLFSSNEESNINNRIYIQIHDEKSNNMVIMKHTGFHQTISVNNTSDIHYVHFWETDIPITKTDIPLSQTIDLHVVNNSNLSICGIIIYGNVMSSHSSICLIGDIQNNVVQYFGTYIISTATNIINTKFNDIPIEIDKSHNVFKHIVYEEDESALYLFKLYGIGWVVANNNTIYLTCFCSSCLITDCGLNEWYYGFKNESQYLLPTVYVNQYSCLNNNLCMNNLTLITNDNQKIDISGNLIPRYNLNQTNQIFVYWQNQNNVLLQWRRNQNEWIYGDVDNEYIICKPGYVEMPLFCTNWSYVGTTHSNWMFTIGNCQNNMSDNINNISNISNIPIFEPDELHNDTMITVIIFCIVAFMLIAIIIVFKLYHHFKHGFKYHLNQRNDIQDGITNNNISKNNDVINDEIDADGKEAEQQHIIINDEETEKEYEEMYEPIKSDITSDVYTSPGGTGTDHAGNMDTDTPTTTDGFKLPIPYYRSDRTTLISMDGQEGSDAVKVWFITKVNIPSSNQEYVTLLLQHGYETIDIVKTIKRDDLNAIGIVKRGHQSKIIVEVEKLNNN